MRDNERSKMVRINIVLSIIVAFIAWVFVVYNYSPMKNVIYKSVPIDFIGEDTLVQNGYGISSASQDSVDVTLSINRTRYNRISAEDIQVTADVSNAAEGSNGITLDVIAPADTTVVKSSASLLTVDVVAAGNKDVDVTAVYTDSTDETMEPVISNMSYSRVSVYGTADNLEKVCCAALQLSVAELSEDSKSFIGTPVALDENGQRVKHIVVFPSEISFDAAAGSTKTVKLTVPIRNTSHDKNMDFEVPESVTIKGSAQLLKTITSVEAETVDVSQISEDVSIPIAFSLPEGISVARRSIGAAVNVVVK